ARLRPRRRLDAHQARRRPARRGDRRDQHGRVPERHRPGHRHHRRLRRGPHLMANALISAPKKARRGDVVEIKALIQHPMETGYRAGTNGRIIPRNIIDTFSATWNGREVVRMALSPAISANPYLSFSAVARESGTVTLRWSGDEGFLVEEAVTIAVE